MILALDGEAAQENARRRSLPEFRNEGIDQLAFKSGASSSGHQQFMDCGSMFRSTHALNKSADKRNMKAYQEKVLSKKIPGAKPVRARRKMKMGGPSSTSLQKNARYKRKGNSRKGSSKSRTQPLGSRSCMD